jgi:hypothetical protein
MPLSRRQGQCKESSQFGTYCSCSSSSPSHVLACTGCTGHWSSCPVNQIMWRLLAHYQWTLTEDIQKHIRRLFYAVGDTKLIEDTHNHLRDLDRKQRHQVVFRTRLFADLTRSPALKRAEMPMDAFFTVSFSSRWRST